MSTAAAVAAAAAVAPEEMSDASSYCSTTPRCQQPYNVGLRVVSSCDSFEPNSADNLNTKPSGSSGTAGNSNVSHSLSTKSTLVVKAPVFTLNQPAAVAANI